MTHFVINQVKTIWNVVLKVFFINLDINLMILDDQRPLVPKWAREVFSDERALKYIKGIGKSIF